MNNVKRILLSTIIFLTYFTPHSFAQNIEQCGLDNNPILSPSEAFFLNDYFKNQKPEFDFHSKKILFVTGPGGSNFFTKKEYFESIKSYQVKNRRIATIVIPLSAKEKKKSGGYDAIVTCWVKFFSKWRKKKMIRKAGK